MRRLMREVGNPWGAHRAPCRRSVPATPTSLLVKVTVMTDEERQDFMRRLNEGMRSMSDAEMEVRAAEQYEGMRNAWPDNAMLGQASMNFWRQEGPFTPVPIQPPPTLWVRFKRWIGG